MEELPAQITALTNLKQLYINNGSPQTIKRAPRGISNLPCWSDSAHRDYKHIRALQLYDPVAASPNIQSGIYAAPARPTAAVDPDSAPIVGDYADVMGVDLARQEVLGEGGFGTAYKVQLRRGTVAVKVLKKKAQPGTPEYEDLTREAKLMVGLSHANIIGLFAYGCKSQTVFYVMEYADGRSVWDVIEGSRKALPFADYIQYSAHINAGLKYLHTRTPPVEHRDLKPENVLLCRGVAKICDFGISTARETISRTTGFKGTFHYAAPEYFDRDKGYGPLSDMYTFGLVVWAMAEGKRPYDGLNMGQIMNEKLQQKLPPIPPVMSAKLAALLNQCWSFEPRGRPSATDLEPGLADIKANPGPAIGEKGKSVKDMTNSELVAYLKGKSAHPDFVSAVLDHEATGEDFVQWGEKDLLSAPFSMTKFQAKVILKFIKEANSS